MNKEDQEHYFNQQEEMRADELLDNKIWFSCLYCGKTLPYEDKHTHECWKDPSKDND